MPWNEPGNNNGNKDPWGNRNKNDGPPDLDEMLKKVTGIFGGGKGGSTSNKSAPKGFFITGLLILAGIWGFSGIYTINEAERGVILHFGQYDRTVGAGLGWVPRGVEKVIKVNTDIMRSTKVEGVMLTKDINIVEVDVGIQYKIESAEDYLFNLADAEVTLNQAAESALRQVVGNSVVDAILTTDKERIQNELKYEMEQVLAGYKSGLAVRTVTLERVRPPREVNDAFEEVNRAAQDAKKVKQEADAYENEKLPLAIAKAEKARQQADAYRATILAKANGEVARFKQLLPQYTAAPEVTRTRLYIDAVEEVMSKSTKVMIDTDGNNNMLYLPLDQIMKNKRGGNNE
ncbi:FtsH protease activity modulator HflK [Aliikangiella sp. G2MR2-5]|uniref:FtsH protease activity modulator HflK n=1 Tax=Aliikangiella sp. G2MR2-5 TaxID=2788943 RepID=UPI0018AC5706|nr:FtsH protease activity modulator HflK [Aliikangiella sp. G2MR2-5]